MNTIARMQHAMFFGLELGVWFAANFVISASSGTAMQILASLIQVYIIFCVYRLAVNYRDTECEGVIGYAEAVKYIIYLFFFSGIIAAAIRFVYLMWLNPEYLSKLVEMCIKSYQEFGIPLTDELRRSLDELLKPQRFVMLGIMGDVMIGTLLALPMGFLLRRKKRSE